MVTGDPRIEDYSVPKFDPDASGNLRLGEIGRVRLVDYVLLVEARRGEAERGGKSSAGQSNAWLAMLRLRQKKAQDDRRVCREDCDDCRLRGKDQRQDTASSNSRPRESRRVLAGSSGADGLTPEVEAHEKVTRATQDDAKTRTRWPDDNLLPGLRCCMLRRIGEGNKTKVRSEEEEGGKATTGIGLSLVVGKDEETNGGKLHCEEGRERNQCDDNLGFERLGMGDQDMGGMKMDWIGGGVAPPGLGPADGYGGQEAAAVVCSAATRLSSQVRPGQARLGQIFKSQVPVRVRSSTSTVESTFLFPNPQVHLYFVQQSSNKAQEDQSTVQSISQ